ncbi:allantoinase [Priestia flexa]|uniref:allantoinase n=1 Tax=Priestia flexa TaxID=86664 RepID=UPI003FD29E67
MKKYDLLIKSGTVVLENEVCVIDIGIYEGKIIALKSTIDTSLAKEVLRAEGMHVLPGAIDIHVHFDEPAREHWEGFDNGSKAMAAGGCTTYFDMPLNGVPPTITKEAFLNKKKLGNEKSFVNFGLWGGLVPGNKDELKKMARQGAIGFKAFMSEAGSEFEFSDGLTLYEGMKEIAKLGKVLALHAEKDKTIKELQKQKEEQGLTSIRSYLETRPIEVEVEAVKEALEYAEQTGCSLHFVHISSKEAVDLIVDAKKRGEDVTVETCPHYLLFGEKDFVQIGALAKCAPPLRSKAEQEKLWLSMEKGEIDMISSDHSPCPMDLKKSNNMFEVWGGISGGQYTLQAMITEGYQKRSIPLTKIAQLTSTAPAKRFGLYPQKGSIQVGGDADLTIVDLKNSYIVKQNRMFFKHKHSIYEGYEFSCTIRYTICEGEIVYEFDTNTFQQPINKSRFVQQIENTNVR